MTAFDHDAYTHLLTWMQDGVVSRRQLLELSATPARIRRMLRTELTAIYPGVYVNHNGPLTPEQRAWCAVLSHEPAALAGESALPHPPTTGPVHIAVPPEHRVRRLVGVHARRMRHFADRVDPMSAPPRIRLEHATIDVAAARPDTAARFRLSADVVQTRRTTAAKILEVLATRHGVPHRSELRELLTDLTEGACSVLEREYLRLERLHGLPSADRQRPDRVGGRNCRRDVPYGDHGLEVELDGRAFHDSADARDRDSQRDLDTAVERGESTIRLTHGQVFREGCATIGKIALLLEKRGWSGPFLRCPDCP